MAIRRNKVDRKADLILVAGRVVDMPPDWTFFIDCPHHGRINFDFNDYREGGRENIAGHMRDAIWSLRHEMVGVSLKYLDKGLRNFWQFLDGLSVTGESITQLSQVDRKLIDRYLLWLELRVVSSGKNQGRPLSANFKKMLFGCLKSVLTNRQKHIPASLSADLSFPRNPYPNSNQLSIKREPYSEAEQKRIVKALNQDLRCIHEGEGSPLPPMQVLAVHLILLGLVTGRNMQSLVDLRRDSLREHPIRDRELLVTTKRRGWSTHSTSMRKLESTSLASEMIRSIPNSVGDHIRFLCDYTAPLMDAAAEGDRDFVFLRRITEHGRKGQVVRLEGHIGAANAVSMWSRRHGILDDHAAPLIVSMARLRPTFATELYRRTRDIRRVQQALGHSNPETTARHYANAPLEAERDHAIVLDGMVNKFTHMTFNGKTLLAADGLVPMQDMKDLLSGGYSTGIARCKNPFREDESVCQKFFHCFKCPSMCVFEDDLWRLFSFYYRLLAERSKINPSHWLKTYGPIIRRIDVDIASQFPLEKVNAARLKAQQTPHPTWRGSLL